MSEEWADIQGYEGLYQVSTLGNVRSCSHYAAAGRGAQRCYHGKMLATWPCKKRHGYLYVDLSKNSIRKKYRVHRLVAKAFIPNPHNLPEINHIDHDVTNNCIDNLEWCTKEYNNSHRTRVGRTCKK